MNSEGVILALAGATTRNAETGKSLPGKAALDSQNTETGALARSVEALAAQAGDPSQEGYGDLWRLAGERHLRSQQARLALERHVAEHGC